MDLLRFISDWWWAVPLVGLAGVAYKFLGWRGLLAVVTLGAAGGLYNKGRTDQREQLERLDQAERLEAIKDRSEVDEQVRKDGPDAARDYLRDRVRNKPPR